MRNDFLPSSANDRDREAGDMHLCSAMLLVEQILLLNDTPPLSQVVAQGSGCMHWHDHLSSCEAG